MSLIQLRRGGSKAGQAAGTWVVSTQPGGGDAGGMAENVQQAGMQSTGKGGREPGKVSWNQMMKGFENSRRKSL